MHTKMDLRDKENRLQQMQGGPRSHVSHWQQLPPPQACAQTLILAG